MCHGSTENTRYCYVDTDELPMNRQQGSPVTDLFAFRFIALGLRSNQRPHDADLQECSEGAIVNITI